MAYPLPSGRTMYMGSSPSTHTPGSRASCTASPSVTKGCREIISLHPVHISVPASASTTWEILIFKPPLRNSDISARGLHLEAANSHQAQPTSRRGAGTRACRVRSEEHTSELQSLRHLVCRLLLEKKK